VSYLSTISSVCTFTVSVSDERECIALSIYGIFISRQYAQHAEGDTVLRTASVCPSSSGIVSNRIHIVKVLDLLIGHDTIFLSPTAVTKFQGNPSTGVKCTGGKICEFRAIAVYV